MNLKLSNGLEVLFQKSTIDNATWWTRISLKNSEVEFEFNEAVFTNEKNDAFLIKTNLAFIVNQIIAQLENLKFKAHYVLKALYNQIFNDTFDTRQVYFELAYIKIVNIKGLNLLNSHIDYRFELHFSIESEIEHYFDIYYSYNATFTALSPDVIVLSSVSRELV